MQLLGNGFIAINRELFKFTYDCRSKTERMLSLINLLTASTNHQKSTFKFKGWVKNLLLWQCFFTPQSFSQTLSFERKTVKQDLDNPGKRFKKFPEFALEENFKDIPF